MRQSIAAGDQLLHCRRRKRAGHNQKAVFIEGFALLGFEWNEVQDNSSFRYQRSAGTIKKFASDVVRSAAPIAEGIKQHDNQHAFIYANLHFRRHKTEIEIGDQRRCSLSTFFFEIRKGLNLSSRPIDRSCGAGANQADAEVFAVMFERQLRYAARRPIRIQPAAGQRR